MSDYKQMYFMLFRAVAGAMEDLQNALEEGECMYMECGGAPLALLSPQADESGAHDD